MKRSPLSIPFLLLAALPGLSCAPSVYRQVYPQLVDGKYDSEFPYRGCSAQLEEIGESVKMVNAIAYYRTYTFAAEERITPGGVTAELLRMSAPHSVVATSQASGTGRFSRARTGALSLSRALTSSDFPIPSPPSISVPAAGPPVSSTR